MGKQVKGWVPPDSDELVETTNSAWVPPAEDQVVEEPVKKKDATVLPPGGGVLTPSAQQPAPSEKSTPNDTDSADLGPLDFKQQLGQISPYKKEETPAGKVRNPLVTLKRKGEDVLLYQIPASLVSSGAAGLGAVQSLVKYPASTIKGTGALPTNYSEKAQLETEAINAKIMQAYSRAQQKIAQGQFTRQNMETLLTAVNDANERQNFLRKFNPGYDKSKIREWQKGLLGWAIDRSQAGGKVSENLINRLTEINDPIDAINWTVGALAESGVQIPAAVATFGGASVGQEIGSIYMDQVIRTAQRRGISPREVIDKGLDDSASAITFGAMAGALDFFGAKGAVSVTKNDLTKSLRRRAIQYITEAGEAGLTESGTELSQTIIEQVGTGQAKDGVDLSELAESAAKGFIGGGGVHSVVKAVTPDVQKTTPEVIIDKVDKVNVDDQLDLDQKAEDIQAKVEQPAAELVQKTMATEDSGAYEFGRMIEGDQIIDETKEENASTIREDQGLVQEQGNPDEGGQDNRGQNAQQNQKSAPGEENSQAEQRTQGLSKQEMTTEDSGSYKFGNSAEEYEVIPRSKKGLVEGKSFDYMPNRNLSEEDKKTETEFANDLNENYEDRKKQYLSENGNVLDADRAKNLSPDYQANPQGKASAVHNPGSSFLFRVFTDLLKQKAPAGKENKVTFVVGGAGSGKTTLVNKLSTDSKSQIVYDTIFGDPQISKNQINRALNAGKDVDVQYVYRDPVESFDAMVDRSAGGRRIVPIKVFSKSHIDSRNTIDQLKNDYDGNKRVTIETIGDVGNKISEEDLVQRLNSRADELFTQGKIDGNQYQQLTGQNPQSREGTVAETPTPQNNEDQTQRGQEGQLLNEGQGPPPPSAEPTDQTAAPTSAQRAFAQQILNDPNISEEIKTGLSEDAKNYIPKGMRITDGEAKAIIEMKGPEQAMSDYLDTTNGMTPDTRVALGENLIRSFNKSGDIENAVKVADNLAKYFTDLGRAVNAAKIFGMLTPEGVLKYVAREITKQKTKFSQRTQGQRQKAKLAIDEINQKAVEKVLGSPKMKAKISSEIKKGSVKKAIDFLETLKVDTKGKLLEGTYGLTAAAWNTLITAVQKGLQAGLTISQAVNKAVQKVKTTDMDEAGARSFLDEQLKDYRVTLDPQRAIKEELKAQNLKIDDVVRQHYTKAAATKKSLVDKLVQDAGLDPTQAAALEKELSAEFYEMTKDAKEKALKKILPRAITPTKRKAKQSAVDKIIEMSNLGALREEEYRDVFSEKMGVPSLSETQARKVTDLANKIQTAKSDFDKNNRTQDLMNFVKGLEGWSWTDVGMAVWYANILSGISTQVLNATANTMETIGEAFVSMVTNPKQAGWILKGLFQGYGRGITESGSVLKTGYDPTKYEQKVGAAGTLERVKFKGGAWNPFTYLKYVGRLMTATDIFFYHGLNEMRARELAVAEARKQGKGQPNKEIIKKATEILYKGVNPYQEAKAQAEQEGFTGNDAKRRAYEILEKSRPEFLIKDSNDEAARGTFNFEPEGTIGAMTAGINQFIDKVNIGGVKPLKFVIPFTRIISNVANRYLDWSPIGLLRAAKGGIGFQTLGENYYRKYTPEQRRDVTIRAITGITAMAAMYALTDDDDGVLKITADGTGDMQKNFELMETGWRPYSIKVGDTWYEYKNTPLAIPFAILGYMRDAEKYKGEKGVESKMSIVMFGTLKYIMDLSFLQALSGFFDTFSKNNPGGAENFFKKTAKATESTVKSVLVPNAFTQISRSVQEVMDLPIKRADQVGDQIIRDMPVLRDHLGNIYNALGEPVVPNQIEKFIPLKPSKSTSESNKIWQIIIDNNAWIGRPRRYTLKLNGESMTDEEYDKYALMAGRMTKEKLEMMLPILRLMKDKEEIKDEIDKVKAEARREARELLFGF